MQVLNNYNLSEIYFYIIDFLNIRDYKKLRLFNSPEINDLIDETILLKFQEKFKLCKN